MDTMSAFQECVANGKEFNLEVLPMEAGSCIVLHFRCV
jgi:hypothetical protein